MGIIQLFVAEMDRVLLSCVSSERDDTEKYAVSGGSPHDNLWFWVMGMGRVVMTPAMRIERTRRNFTDESNRYDAKRERLVRCARELAERGNAAKVSVTDVTSEMGITLSDEDLAKIVELMKKLSALDIDVEELKRQAAGLYDELKRQGIDLSEYGIDASDMDGAAGFLARLWASFRAFLHRLGL